jgi:hypothetical protein
MLHDLRSHDEEIQLIHRKTSLMEEIGISDIPVMEEDDEMQTCDIESKAQENRFPLTAISNHHCGWY